MGKNIDKYMARANGLYNRLAKQVNSREPKTRVVATLAEELKKAADAGNKFGSKAGAEITNKIKKAKKEVQEQVTEELSAKSNKALVNYQKELITVAERYAALADDEKEKPVDIKKLLMSLKNVALPKI